MLDNLKVVGLNLFRFPAAPKVTDGRDTIAPRIFGVDIYILRSRRCGDLQLESALGGYDSLAAAIRIVVPGSERPRIK